MCAGHLALRLLGVTGIFDVHSFCLRLIDRIVPLVINIIGVPGTMTLIGRIGGAQIIGVPACALFFKTTVFDIILPRMLAGVPITRLDLAKIGHGGLCMECKVCTFPKCPFGKV